MFKWLFVAFLCCTSLFADQSDNDPTIALARILTEKGTITASDLSRVQSADDHQRLSILTAILQEKGVLNNNDLARLSPPALPSTQKLSPEGSLAGVTLEPVSAHVSTPQQPQSQAQITEVAVTTKKRVPISLYGTLLFTAGYNTANANFEDLPMILSKQGTDPTGGDKNFYETVRQSRFGLNLDPISSLGGKLSGTFEFDMMGGQAPYANGIGMNLFRMRLAYGRLDWNNVAVEAGQDWSVFAPLNPTSLNEFGIPEFTATGNLWIRAPQLRVELRTKHPNGNNLLWQTSASDPNVGDLSTAVISAARQPGIGERGRMPSLQSRLAFTHTHNDRNYTIGLSGDYGRGKNAGLLGTRNIQNGVDSWGVALDYSLPVTKFLSLTGEAYEGRALGIFSSASAESIGAVGTAGAHGVESRGGWAQAQFNFNKQWQLNLDYGIDVPRASQLPVGNRSRNQQYMANVIDKLTRNINMSVEYRRILTDFRNQAPLNERGDHVDLGMAFIF